MADSQISDSAAVPASLNEGINCLSLESTAPIIKDENPNELSQGASGANTSPHEPCETEACGLVKKKKRTRHRKKKGTGDLTEMNENKNENALTLGDCDTQPPVKATTDRPASGKKVTGKINSQPATEANSDRPLSGKRSKGKDRPSSSKTNASKIEQGHPRSSMSHDQSTSSSQYQRQSSGKHRNNNTKMDSENYNDNENDIQDKRHVHGHQHGQNLSRYQHHQCYQGQGQTGYKQSPGNSQKRERKEKCYVSKSNVLFL